MASSNIKLFDENKGNMLSDSEFSISTQRLNGLQTGVASSQLQNKAMYQASLVAYAIAQIMMQNGLNANDTDAVSAFVANLSGAMLQKVYDLATTAEAQAGVATGKWMSPALVKAAIDTLAAKAQNILSDTTKTLYGLGSSAVPDDVFAEISRRFSDMSDNLNAQYSGSHNAIYRGKYLGNSVTAEQYAAIQAGTFDDLYIGDYWTIGDINYRIAAFNYYYMTLGCTENHVTLVPDAPMYTHCMNDTNVTTGGYVGSKMYTTGLADAKATINNAFGSAHILTHKQYLCNAVTNGKPSGGSWYDSTVELMTEQNVYGAINCSYVPALPTKDKSQYPLFSFRPDLISKDNHAWLRDVASAAAFCRISSYGLADYIGASDLDAVRPAFSIKA